MYQTKQLLTRTEAAEALAVSLRKLDYLIAAGELPVVRLGGRTIRIRPSAIDYFVEAREGYSNRESRR